MRLVTIIGSLFLLFLPILNINCHQDKQYKILRVFFDGVPDPKDGEKEEKATKVKSQIRSSPNNLQQHQKRIKSSHPDFLKNRCDKCHDKSSANMLKGGTKQFCFSCHQHKPETFTGRYIHGPVAVHKCSACHHPHTSVNNSLLKKVGKELCHECHRQGEKKIFKSCNRDQLCTDCHLAHVSAKKYLIKDATK